MIFKKKRVRQFNPILSVRDRSMVTIAALGRDGQRRPAAMCTCGAACESGVTGARSWRGVAAPLWASTPAGPKATKALTAVTREMAENGRCRQSGIPGVLGCALSAGNPAPQTPHLIERSFS